MNFTGRFISESEDELALLTAAYSFGFKFVRKTEESLHVKVFNKEEIFDLIGLLPFDSERKLMSVVVRSPQGETILFCKGSDHSVLARCKMTSQRRKSIQEVADRFGQQSLRTMVIAMRVLDPETEDAFEQFVHEKRKKR